jgi:glycosyltransferase involved in cell wall biosynthesis
MRILFISHNSSLRSTTCVLDALISRKEQYDIEPFFVFSQAGPWQKQLSTSGIKTYIKNVRLIQYSKPITAVIDTLNWIKLIKQHKIQLIHVNEHENYLAIRLAARLTSTPVVVGVRFVIGEDFANWAFGGKNLPARLLFTSNDQLARSQLANSLPKSAITLLGNGRDLCELTTAPDRRKEYRSELKIREDEVLLGTASVIRPRKKLEDFIFIVHELIKRGYPVKGAIAGGGKFGDQNYFKKLQALIIELHMDDHIMMVGNLEEMAPFYQATDLFISTSELETFGMSVCEAMAFGKPVIGYEGGSVSEVLGDDRCIVETGDKKALLNLAESILRDQEFFISASQQGRTRAFENYDAPALAERLFSIYNEVLAQ